MGPPELFIHLGGVLDNPKSTNDASPATRQEGAFSALTRASHEAGATET